MNKSNNLYLLKIKMKTIIIKGKIFKEFLKL